MSRIPPLSVIIPAHNAANTLDACLGAVLDSSTPIQVIVVDDGSTDATAQIAEKRRVTLTDRSAQTDASPTGSQYQIVRLNPNRGAAAARNAGARVADAPILFFLDADILMDRGTARRILDEFQHDPALAALFGSYQKETGPQNFFSVYKNLLHHYTHQNAQVEAATFCGGFGAIRRKVFCALGGFDEAYLALEDIELGYRIHRAGYPILLVKDLQFTHLKKYTLVSLVHSDMFHRAIPWTRLMLDRRIFRNDLNTRSNNLASVVVVFLLLGAPLWVWFVPLGFVLAAALAVLFVLLNLDFIRFVTRERGWWFGVRATGMTWFNYMYSGVGLLLGVVAFARHALWRAG